MISNSSTKSSRCIGSSLASAARRRLLVVGEDHLAHGADAVLVEEHVLGAAQADAFGAEPTATRASFGVSALARTLSLRAASAQPISVANSPDSAGSIIAHLAGEHLAGRAVDGDDVALLARDPAGGERVAPHSRRVCAPAPETQGLPMPRATTAAWEVMPPRAVRMPSRGVHAVDVLGARLDAHQDRPARPCDFISSASSEENTTSPDAAPGEAGRPVAITLRAAVGIDGRMEELVERAGIDPGHRLVAR